MRRVRKGVSVFEVSGDRNSTGETLDRAPGGRLGDVLTPQRLFVCGPALEFLAVTDPLDPVISGENDLDGSGRE